MIINVYFQKGVNEIEFKIILLARDSDVVLGDIYITIVKLQTAECRYHRLYTSSTQR